ncbi:MAG: DUF5666 domain-containing protein [Chloroflexota bacterium]
MFERIVAAIDSDAGRADQVVKAAQELGQALHVEVLVAHVRDVERRPAMVATAGRPGALPPRLHFETEEKAQELVNGAVEQLRQAGVKAEGQVGPGAGSTARELLDIAEVYSANLIVVGDRDSRVTDVILGGVAHRIVHRPLTASTAYRMGAAPTTRLSVKAGTTLSVRCYRTSSGLQATLVHVYVVHPHRIAVSGSILSTRRGSLVVRTSARLYAVTSFSGVVITINGSGAPASALRPGDRVRVHGSPGARGTIIASSIRARRPRDQVVTVRGTISSIQGNILVVTASTGTRIAVRLSSGVSVMLHGLPAPGTALFAGARITIRGRRNTGGFVGTGAVLSVRERTIEGRIETISHSVLSVRARGHDSNVSLSSKTEMRDGGKKIDASHLRVGTYVHVQGYQAPADVIAATLRVMHPSLEVKGTVANPAPALLVQSRNGDTYRIRLSSATSVSDPRYAITLSASDIMVGQSVDVRGTVRTDGRLAAVDIAVHLVHVALRGRVTDVASAAITVDVGGAAIEVGFDASASLTQGSKQLTLADVVRGDDVSVSGYRISVSTVVARKISVHRRVKSIQGTVASLTTDGFVLTTSVGSIRVIESTTTSVTGGSSVTLVVAAAVHVTGYLRGDGVILATRIRLLKHL